MRKESSITIRLESSLMEALKIAADKERRTVGAYIRNVLDGHFQPTERDMASEQA